MGVRKRVIRQLIDGGIVVAIVCGLLAAQQHGCFESTTTRPSPDAGRPCGSDAWQTDCDRAPAGAKH